MAGTAAMDTTPSIVTARIGIMAGIAAITTAGTSIARATTIIAITGIGADTGFWRVWN